MHTPSCARLVRNFSPLLLALCATAAMMSAIASQDQSLHTGTITLAQADTTPSASEAPPEHGHAAPVQSPEELPRMTNKAAAFWGVVFMSTVSVAFAVFAVYAIRQRHKQKPR
jgi:hypothetical protein